MPKLINWRMALFIFLLVSLLATATRAKEFDGIWFLGFNIQRVPFEKLPVRQAVAHVLDPEYISVKIAGETEIPASFIPPGMNGYDLKLQPYKRNLKYAKALMKKAKYLPTSLELKQLTLLHTDGVKTVEIAKLLQKELKVLGIDLQLVQMSYWDQAKWDAALASRRYHLFLMGFKADLEQVFTTEAEVGEPDSLQLLEPLFRTTGAANFTGYNNPTLDMLFDQTSVIDRSYRSERNAKLKEINKILYQELPAIVLFYIERL